jgi:hypothetical protein
MIRSRPYRVRRLDVFVNGSSFTDDPGLFDYFRLHGTAWWFELGENDRETSYVSDAAKTTIAKEQS